MLSGIIHRLYGYDNVGFHLGAAETTMDFNGELTSEQVREVEKLANQAVWDNIPVEILYPTKEELASMDYRSKIEIEGQVRIVTIPDIDVCACCAPHVNTTGEIGLIKLTNVQSHRGGVRVNLLAGDRALRDYREKESSVKAVSVLLSAKEAVVADAVERLKQENFRLTGQLMALSKTLIQNKAASVAEGTANPIFFEDNLDADTSREFVNLLSARCSGIACLFIGNDESGYRYIFGSKTEDTRPLCKALNGQFGGKGGGKPEMVQGSLSGTQEELMGAVETFLRS